MHEARVENERKPRVEGAKDLNMSKLYTWYYSTAARTVGVIHCSKPEYHPVTLTDGAQSSVAKAVAGGRDERGKSFRRMHTPHRSKSAPPIHG